MGKMPNYKYIVVEDESLICKNLIKKITSLTLPFELAGSASNGMDALLLLEKVHPQLVITDIRMPQYDGLKLASHIHKNYPHTQVVIISGYDDFSYAQTAIKYRVADYLLKPVKMEALSEALHKVLITLSTESDTLNEFHTDANNLSQESICELMENYLQLNYNKDVSLSALAEQLGFTQEYLGKIFKKNVGETPSKYLTRLRINEAKLLLTNHPDMEIQKIGELVGYKDAFYFSRVFKNYTGNQPSEYRAHQLELR